MPFSLTDALQIELPTVRILDVGASMVEGPDHYAPLVDRGLAEVIGFEPDAEQFARLQASGREHYRYLPYALGTGGTQTFHVAHFPGCSSLLPPNPAWVDRFTAIGATGPHANFRVTHTVPVETHRLDDLPDVPAPDYIKLDIQGVERDVLSHGARTLSSTVVIESEVLFGPLYEGQGDFADLTLLLREQGFQLLELRDVHRCVVAPFLTENTPFPSRGQWMWADAVYVRRWEDLSSWTEPQLLKAAAILHEVYAMYDLVHHMLIEIQLRTGANLADRYRAAMGQQPELVQSWKIDPRAWSKALPPERLVSAGRHRAAADDRTGSPPDVQPVGRPERTQAPVPPETLTAS